MKRFVNSPAFIILIALVILNILNGEFSNPQQWFMDKLMILPGIIIGISFHEFAHGAVSYALGDPTPKQQGRLTINPFAHLDPFGFIALLIAGFGWGVPVQIDPRYYKHRRIDELLVALAGVVMNFVLAILFSLLAKLLITTNGSFLGGEAGQILLNIIQYVIFINIVLMVFNLLPVPPLDGFGIVTEIFNLRKYSWYYKVYDKGFVILLILIMFNITDYVLNPAVSGLYRWMIATFIL